MGSAQKIGLFSTPFLPNDKFSLWEAQNASYANGVRIVNRLSQLKVLTAMALNARILNCYTRQ